MQTVSTIAKSFDAYQASTACGLSQVMQGLHLELPAFFENDPDQEWAKFIHNESRGVATSLNCVLPTDLVDRDKTYVHRCFQKALLHCDDIEVCWKGPSTTYQRSKSHRGSYVFVVL